MRAPGPIARMCRLARPSDGRRAAASPIGAFVVIAANLGASAADTAAATGLTLDEVRALAVSVGAHASQHAIERLGAWVALCMLRALDSRDVPEVDDRVRCELIVRAWGGPTLWVGRGAAEASLPESSTRF